jgi:Uma2 family endonuclease
MTLELQKPKIAVEAFDQWVDLPENANRLFEYVGGEIVEKMPTNARASEIAGMILFYIRLFLFSNEIAGHVTAGDGGYRVAGERYAPDVAYISKIRQPDLAEQGYNPNPPELAVEVISDPDNQQEHADLRIKVTNYLLAGTIVWVVNPQIKIVEVYHPGKNAIKLGENDTLSGGDVLPGFELAVKAIFES